MGSSAIYFLQKAETKMKEYTLIAVISLAFPFILEAFFKTGIFKIPSLYITLSFIFICKILVNGFLTSFPVVLYNPASYLGIRFGTIPIEDFLFGFSMVASTLLLWEYFKKRGL